MAFKVIRLASIPEDQFEELLKRPDLYRLGINGFLRLADKLAAERPRQAARASAAAIDLLERAMDHIKRLRNDLRELGSDAEVALVDEIAATTASALHELCFPALGRPSKHAAASSDSSPPKIERAESIGAPAGRLAILQ
jgi:hypothetical protein